MKKRIRFAGYFEMAALLAMIIGLVLVTKFLRINSETATDYPGSSLESITSTSANLPYPGSEAKFAATSETQLAQAYPFPESEALPTSEVIYNVPPPCQANAEFATSSTQANFIPQQNYVFSNPRAITGKFSLIDIVQWLPDSRRLLLLSGDEKGQSIETVDIVTGETRLYVRNLEDPGLVLWVPEKQGVAYVDRKMYNGSIQSPLMLSTGISETQILLMKEFQYIGDGNPVPDNLPETLFQKINPVFSFDPKRWEYDKFHNEATEVWRRSEYRAAVSPDGAMTAYYGSPWFLLVDVKTGQPCEINLAPFAVRAREVQWSDDGRYLAILAANDYPGMLLRSNRIAIFDLMTGKLARLNEINYVTKMDWLPNSDNLLIFGFNKFEPRDDHLYIINPNEMKLYPVLPEYIFWGSIGRGPDHILSPDGNFVAIRCQDGNLCVISIESKP